MVGEGGRRAQPWRHGGHRDSRRWPSPGMGECTPACCGADGVFGFWVCHSSGSGANASGRIAPSLSPRAVSKPKAPITLPHRAHTRPPATPNASSVYLRVPRASVVAPFSSSSLSLPLSPLSKLELRLRAPSRSSSSCRPAGATPSATPGRHRAAIGNLGMRTHATRHDDCTFCLHRFEPPSLFDAHHDRSWRIAHHAPRTLPSALRASLPLTLPLTLPIAWCQALPIAPHA